jgi:hypothetical protein
MLLRFQVGILLWDALRLGIDALVLCLVSFHIYFRKKISRDHTRQVITTIHYLFISKQLNLLFQTWVNNFTRRTSDYININLRILR